MEKSERMDDIIKEMARFVPNQVAIVGCFSEDDDKEGYIYKDDKDKNSVRSIEDAANMLQPNVSAQIEMPSKFDVVQNGDRAEIQVETETVNVNKKFYGMEDPVASFSKEAIIADTRRENNKGEAVDYDRVLFATKVQIDFLNHLIHNQKAFKNLMKRLSSANMGDVQAEINALTGQAAVLTGGEE